MQVLANLRYGFRLLARSPVFAATAVLVLAIGISANAVIFSVVDAFLLRKLPVDQPERLVRLIQLRPNGGQTWHFTSELCETIATTSTTFSEVLCQGQLDVALRVGGATERVSVHLVSPAFFSTLGVGTHIGRTFDPSGDHIEETTAVLSHHFWQRRFQGDTSVLDRTLILNGNPFVVIGVSTAGFSGLAIDTSPDIRVLASARRPLTNPEAAREMPAQIFARLRPGQSIEAAQAEIEPFVQVAYGDDVKRRWPNGDVTREWIRANRFQLQPIAHGVSALRTRFRNGLLALVAGAGFLLIMACANVAGLLLARTVARSPELGVRMALGAGRWRIVRQLFVEGLPLAFLGGLAGTILTYACLPLVVSSIPPVRDRAAVLHPLAVLVEVNGEVLVFTVGVALLSTLLFGLSPALTGSRIDVMSTLRSGRTTTRRLSLQKVLVVAQVAACTVLLLGAALLIKTLEQMRSMDTGFDRDRIVTFTIDPSMLGYEPERAYSLARQLIRETQSLPMISAVSIAGRGLMRGTGLKRTLLPAGERISQDDFLNCNANMLTEGYFETMGMRLIAGRDFAASDENQAKPKNVIVSEAFASRFFPGEDPIGKRIGGGIAGSITGADMRIVGVVTDSKYRSLREEIHPVVYSHAGKSFEYGFVLHARTRDRHPETAIGPVRGILRSLDPELPFVEINVLEHEVETSLWQERLLAALSSVFGAIAALLAAIGLFGALDYAVRTRTREIGVRVALGATAGDIGRMLGREALGLLAIGVVVGLSVHFALAGWIRQVLYEVHPFDATALAYALAVVAGVCIVATLPPITRAVRIRPSEALRQD